MKIVPYNWPKWASVLKNIPATVYENLAMKPTPIHLWKMPNIPDSFQLSIKRDDMTGFLTGGNKIRKLEFIMAEANRRGCKHIISCGGINSNHCRAVALSARLLGLKPHFFLRTNSYRNPSLALGDINAFIDCLLGADIYLVPKRARFAKHLMPAMQELAATIEKETSEKAMVVPVGGSDEIGIFGPLELFQELLDQDLANQFDDIVVAVGSGGTAAGLALGNYLSDSKLKIHAVSVSDDKKYFHEHCQEMIDCLGVNVRSEDILHIIDGYKGAGYGIASPELLEFTASTAVSTGVVLDPVYTGKAAFGMCQELRLRPDQFQGHRILFIHTGGFYTKEAQSTLEQQFAIKNVKTWPGKMED